jgi:4'-phosphopantetheinyl transferase
MSQSMNICDANFQIAAPVALPEDEVQLWLVDLEAVRANESRWQEILSGDESERASRFYFLRDRQSFVASRAVLRMILAGYLAVDPGSLNFSYSKREKPFLGAAYAESDIRFNVTHSGDIAMLAFTRQREIGVDVEQIRSDVEVESIARRFFSTNERMQLAALPSEEKVDAFFRCWTRKEAYIKATGDGLSLPLDQFDVSLGMEAGNALLATRPDESEVSRWLLREVPTEPGYIAAVCARGQDWSLKSA